MRKLDYKEYPTPVSRRVGIKVSWYTYDTKAEAEKCARAARHNADIQASLGYDFGYQMPGSITKTKNGFEVTIP